MSFAFASLGDHREILSQKPMVELFPKAKAAFFDVRGQWQCLLLGSLEGPRAKAEIFGPALPPLFQRLEVRSVFGQLSIIVLNPVKSLRDLAGDYSSLKKETERNCVEAGRSKNETEKRVRSIDDPKAHEANAWLQMLDLDGAIEFAEWPFPEYRYAREGTSVLVQARRHMVGKSPALEEFFRPEDEIR